MNAKARGTLILSIGILIGLALPFAIVAVVDSLASPATASESVPLEMRASAAGGTVADPNGVAPDRYVYYPGTEALAEDEIRVVACGTGMPSARIRQQAASFWSDP